MDIRSGVDTNTVCTPDTLACLKRLGFAFVIRYYRSRNSSQPRLTPEEALRISKAGFELGVVFEFKADMSEFTAAQAKLDAEDALREAAAVGQPHGSAIYFAVDFQPPSAKAVTGPIADYFRIVRSMVHPKFRVGVYGSGDVCDALLKAGLVEFTWLSQSVGFSGTPGFTRWNLKQGVQHTFCAPLDTDIDDAHGEFGGFKTAAP